MDDRLADAARAVRAQFIPAEAGADRATAQTARLLATLLEQRSAAGLPPGTGAALVRAVSRCLAAQIEARERFAMAHKLAASTARELGIDPGLYGDTQPCPPDGPSKFLLGAERDRRVVRLADR